MVMPKTEKEPKNKNSNQTYIYIEVKYFYVYFIICEPISKGLLPPQANNSILLFYNQ